MVDVDWPSLVTAIGTGTLAILTAVYIYELRKQNKERFVDEIHNRVYVPLLKNLQEIVQIPDVIEWKYRKPEFQLKELREKVPHLYFSLPRRLREQIEDFDKRYKQYQGSLGETLRRLYDLGKEEMEKYFEKSFDKRMDLSLSVVSIFSGEKISRRNIFSLVIDGVNPQDYFISKQQNYEFPVKQEFKLYPSISSNIPHSVSTKRTEILPTQQDFEYLYKAIKSRIEKDELLRMSFERQQMILEDACSIIKEIENRISRKML